MHGIPLFYADVDKLLRHQCLMLMLCERLYNASVHADMMHPGRALSAFAQFGQHANTCIIKHATWLYSKACKSSFNRV